MPEFALINRLVKPTLLIPNFEYLIKFVNGDLGIADSIYKSTMLSTISKITNPDILEQFLSMNNISTEKSIDDLFQDGKLLFNESDFDIKAPDFSGIKPLEKSLLQSIFETQKPYMEILKILVENLVRIEDLIAVILAVGGMSLNPIYNKKALGYKDANPTIEQVLVQLQELIDYKESNFVSSDKNLVNPNVKYPLPNLNKYEIISTEYSTGQFDPRYDYEYTYIDLMETINSIKPKPYTYRNVDDNKYIDDLPKTIVFGYYDMFGHKLQTVPRWLEASGKWFGYFDQIENLSIDEFTDYYRNYTIDTMDDTIPYDTRLSSINQAISVVNMNEFKDLYTSNGYLEAVYKNGVIHPIKQRVLKAKKLNINGKDVWIDPESDYNLKLIRLFPKFPPLSQNNDHLSTKDPYSNGYYGFPDKDHNQSFQDSYWNDPTEPSDYYIPQIYYILEGVLPDEETKGTKTKRGVKFYNLKDYRKVPAKFIRILGYIFAKLMPALKSLIKLFKDPVNFIIDIILQKLGDANGTENVKFSIFSMPFYREYSVLKSFGDSTNLVGDELKSFVDKKISYVESSTFLKEYIFVYPDGTHRFLMDGAALSELFGIVFGVNVNFENFDIIFGTNTKNNYLNSNSPLLNLLSNKDIITKFSNTSNITLSYTDDKLNKDNIEVVKKKTIEEINIWYSTGEFNDKYQYDYIYVTEYVSNLIISAQEILNKYNLIDNNPDTFAHTTNVFDDPVSESDRTDLQKAASLLEEALRNDPNNEYVISLLSNVKKMISSLSSNPIIKFILNMVEMPIKLVKEVIDYIITFFSLLKNPFKVPTEIGKFLGFQWFFDIFDPMKILSLIGIKFDIDKFKTWKEYIKSGQYESEFFGSDNIPKQFENFDFQEVIDIAFFSRMPKVDPNMMENLTSSPLSLLKGILGLLQQFINGIIKFFWALLGLDALKKSPTLNFTKDTNTDLNVKDFQDLLNGIYSDIINYNDLFNPVTNVKDYDFVYNIQLSDGRNLRDLNRYELERWIDENKDGFDITFNI